jgi:hypothetical protein
MIDIVRGGVPGRSWGIPAAIWACQVQRRANGWRPEHTGGQRGAGGRPEVQANPALLIAARVGLLVVGDLPKQIGDATQLGRCRGEGGLLRLVFPFGWAVTNGAYERSRRPSHAGAILALVSKERTT